MILRQIDWMIIILLCNWRRNVCVLVRLENWAKNKQTKIQTRFGDRRVVDIFSLFAAPVTPQLYLDLEGKHAKGTRSGLFKPVDTPCFANSQRRARKGEGKSTIGCIHRWGVDISQLLSRKSLWWVYANLTFRRESANRHVCSGVYFGHADTCELRSHVW